MRENGGSIDIMAIEHCNGRIVKIYLTCNRCSPTPVASMLMSWQSIARVPVDWPAKRVAGGFIVLNCSGEVGGAGNGSVIDPHVATSSGSLIERRSERRATPHSRRRRGFRDGRRDQDVRAAIS
jgi:hypothetical protein